MISYGPYVKKSSDHLSQMWWNAINNITVHWVYGPYSMAHNEGQIKLQESNSMLIIYGSVQFSRDPRIEIYFPNPYIIVFLGKNFWKIRLTLLILLYDELMTFISCHEGQKSKSQGFL